MMTNYIILTSGECKINVPMSEWKSLDMKWMWVDFYQATKKEARVLTNYFRFHPLAIEDCMEEYKQRPKVDYYEDYIFLLLHTYEQTSGGARELNMFVGKNYLVTYRSEGIIEIDEKLDTMGREYTNYHTTFELTHRIIDDIIDHYFTPVYRIEDQLNNIEEENRSNRINDIIEELFDIRLQMSHLRRSLVPMRDLIYRLVNRERLKNFGGDSFYFQDVYDHVLKQVEMLESYREFSSDIRDNYLSINSDQMNKTMMTLTLYSMVFLPLTFIVGVYGMNFTNMPELQSPYGYPAVWGVMISIAIIMVVIFHRIGWLNFTFKKKIRRRKKLDYK
ncbi:metal transporter [Bacillus coahuilensis p1.1.43]|uniref:Magnesium transport protein CorA n=1 Tax=Bacillus coahuilensis p1.1.43 TaxID=1150625 RepID=A0A147KAD1_9BACI|nr:magnesium/cobalt transporter CorA [Bacillus coahuilensis]KUP07611.1 metal transporter [Bacillus coahuilensis p1.1.43]